MLARLNRGPHIVLAATHDIELAELLRGDDYELHHFREEVADGRLVFDYCLHTGPLTTRNAIRILELYDYPPELIAEAVRHAAATARQRSNRARFITGRESVQKPERAQNRTRTARTGHLPPILNPGSEPGSYPRLLQHADHQRGGIDQQGVNQRYE